MIGDMSNVRVQPDCRCGATFVALLALLMAPSPAVAQLNDGKLPEDMEDVKIVERLSNQVPLDLEFISESDRFVKLRELVRGDKPVILTLNYYRCPMLCGLVLEGLLNGLKELNWTPGREFEIVTVSFDPLETAQLARLKKENYVEAYGRPEAAAGWHFLTGRRDPLLALREAVGFPIRWNEEKGQWMHDLAIIVLTPDGRVSRYLYGVLFEPQTLKLALMEAADGKIGSTMDRVTFMCFQWDSKHGRYTANVMLLMQTGAVLTMLALGALVGGLWWREMRQRRLRVIEV